MPRVGSGRAQPVAFLRTLLLWMPVRRCLLGVVRGQCHPALTRQPAPHEPPPNPPLPGFLSPLIVSESSLGKRRKVQTLSYIAASRRHPRALDERSALPAPGADLRNTKSNGVWSEHHTLPDYRALNQTRRCKGAVAIVFASPPDVPVESRLGPAPLSGQSSVPTAHACT